MVIEIVYEYIYKETNDNQIKLTVNVRKGRVNLFKTMKLGGKSFADAYQLPLLSQTNFKNYVSFYELSLVLM